MARRGKKSRTKKRKKKGARPAKPAAVEVVDEEPSSVDGELGDPAVHEDEVATDVADASGAEPSDGEPPPVFDLGDDEEIDVEVELERLTDVEPEVELEGREEIDDEGEPEGLADTAAEVELEGREEIAGEAPETDVEVEVASEAGDEDRRDGDGEALDLGPTSTPEARARLLAEALAHAEMQEARYRVPIGSRTLGRIKAGIALTIFALAGILALTPPELVVPDPPTAVVDADRVTGVVTVLALQAQQIDAFRVREQRLPATLAEAGPTVPGVRYVRSSDRLYQLVAYTPSGRAIVYDSAAPAPAFLDPDLAWRSGEGS